MRTRIRKLTPIECFRLQGFDDQDFIRASEYNSDTQLYKQAGNSITVNVLEHIMGNLIKQYGEELDNMDKIAETKLVTYDTDKFFDIALLAEKEPELFEELCEDYPVEDGTYQYIVG